MSDFFTASGKRPFRNLEGFGGSSQEREKKIETHPDFDHNQRQAENLIRNTCQRWPAGMLITISGSAVTLSYQRQQLQSTYACPVNINQSNSKFKLELQATYKHYHELAVATNRTIKQIDLPTEATHETKIVRLNPATRHSLHSAG